MGSIPPVWLREEIFLAGGLVCQKTGGGQRSVLCRNNVHCSQTLGDVDVIPMATGLKFEESRMVNVWRCGHTAVQCGFNFR